MRIDKNLLLDSELCDLVEQKLKNVTVRFGKRDIENHNDFLIIDLNDETRTFSAKIKNITYKQIKQMSANDLKLAGKENTAQEYLDNTLLKYYPNATMDDEVTIIEFLLK